MHVSSETQSVTAPQTEPAVDAVLDIVIATLDKHKAADINSIDLSGKSNMADYMVIASGGSQRQVAALTDYIMRALKEAGVKDIKLQGLEQADWVLIDAGDIVIHLFRPEVREFYNLDKMWGAALSGSDNIDPANLN